MKAVVFTILTQLGSSHSLTLCCWPLFFFVLVGLASHGNHWSGLITPNHRLHDTKYQPLAKLDNGSFVCPSPFFPVLLVVPTWWLSVVQFPIHTVTRPRIDELRSGVPTTLLLFLMNLILQPGPSKKIMKNVRNVFLHYATHHQQLLVHGMKDLLTYLLSTQEN